MDFSFFLDAKIDANQRPMANVRTYVRARARACARACTYPKEMKSARLFVRHYAAISAQSALVPATYLPRV